MSEKIELFFSSPEEYEKLTIEVQLEREKIAEINQDKGTDNLEIELFGTDQAHNFIAKMPLDKLINALIKAREEIIKDNL